jgi:hypothetical protein
MQKAMFFEDAFKQGVLAKITSGYILSLTSPDLDDIDKKNDPFLFEMISYSGVKAVTPVESGVKFQAQGRKMFCMIEPTTYNEKYVEPTYRSTNGTGFMPFRFAECDSFLTKDSKYTVRIPCVPHNCFDSFTVSFPAKGDLCILYFIFDQDIKGKVLPFIEENFMTILKKSVNLRDIDSNNVAKKFAEVIKKLDIWAGKMPGSN